MEKFLLRLIACHFTRTTRLIRTEWSSSFSSHQLHRPILIFFMMQNWQNFVFVSLHRTLRERRKKKEGRKDLLYTGVTSPPICILVFLTDQLTSVERTKIRLAFPPIHPHVSLFNFFDVPNGIISRQNGSKYKPMKRFRNLIHFKPTHLIQWPSYRCSYRDTGMKQKKKNCGSSHTVNKSLGKEWWGEEGGNMEILVWYHLQKGTHHTHNQRSLRDYGHSWIEEYRWF